MLICKKCQIEYEEDKKFCSQCASFLVSKEAVMSDFEDTEKTIEEKPKEKYICPDCKIIFEKMRPCIRCGTEVLPLASFQGTEELETDSKPEVEIEFPQVKTTQERQIESPSQHLICPMCKKIHPRGKSCIKCGAALTPLIQFPEEERTKLSDIQGAKKHELKTPYPPEDEEGLPQARMSDQPFPQRSSDELVRKVTTTRKTKKDYSRIFLNLGGITIICIAAGYLLWSIYSYMVTKKPDSSAIPSSTEMATPLAPTSIAVAPSNLSGAETEEREGIGGLLENIRKANLEKDIHLFMSCYSKDFKDREVKKKATLESWGNFNFLDLSYDLKTCSISGDVARARVEWLVRFSQKTGGQSQESKTALEVTFKKEEGRWKIEEIKSIL